MDCERGTRSINPRRVPCRVELQIGCVGYSYDFWVGPFYPRHTTPADYLRLYGKVFDLVEIDSSFYKIPTPDVTRAWRASVPPQFRFSLKAPRKVTHEHAFEGIEGPMAAFLRGIEPLRPTAGPILLQLPPSFAYPTGADPFFEFLDSLPKDYRYAVEFRHGSWMHGGVFTELRRREIAMVWNETEHVETVPEVTTDFLYLRFIGDRSLDRLGTVQIDRSAEMTRWAERLRRVEGDVARAYVLFNNHFAGLGPATADQFRNLLGLPPLDLAAMHTPDRGQMRLSSFP